jgi:hypothetical protein
VNVHHFDETINGREYRIEVSNIGGTWRAQIARLPGGSAALMPFYGKTPDEAAAHLSRWLTLAHRSVHPAAEVAKLSSLDARSREAAAAVSAKISVR